MYKMCHEPINISPAESGITFPELDHLPLTRRRSLLQSSESVSQRITASVPASNVDSVVKREEDCISETCVVSNSGTSECTRISCSQGLDDSVILRPQNNTVACCSNAEESSNRVEQIKETAGNDSLEHLTLKERRKMLLERMALRSPETNLEDNTKDCGETELYDIKAEISCENEIASSSGIRFSGFLKNIDSYLFKKVSIGSECGSQLNGIQESDIPRDSRDYEHSGYADAAEKPRNS
ncbi:unnamed protein product [Microthlaspi erraticum]|uniref:Uncharacterized protein n=1 Tax=Microthlaspi erraticum TaxID=1685480 RepID=A0A6D2KET3_9BRAS|nr:unnamed protein product [Microthlaspi erraticum]